MATRQGPPIQFRDVALSAALDLRGDKHGLTAARDLGRYYDLLDREAGTVVISPDSWAILRDLVGNSGQSDWSAAYLAMSAADAGHAALAKKLATLCPGQVAALIDTVERWWRRAEHRHEPV